MLPLTVNTPSGEFTFFSDGFSIVCQDDGGYEPFTLPLSFPVEHLKTVLDIALMALEEGYENGETETRLRIQRALGLI